MSAPVNMDNVHFIGIYSIVTTVVLFLGTKDQILTGLWTTAVHVRLLHSKSSKDFYEDVKKEDLGLRLTICREISDLLVSQLMGWTTLIFLASHPETLTKLFRVPQRTFLVDSSTTTSITINDPLLFTELLLCLQVGRMIYRTYHHTFVQYHSVELINSAILAISYVAFLLPGVSTCVALVGIAGDVSDFHVHVSKIMDVRGIPCYSKSLIHVYLAGVIATFVGRCLLPIVLIVIALTFDIQDSVQSNFTGSSLALFCFFLTYLIAINVFLGVNALNTFNEARSLRRLYQGAMRDNAKALELALSMKFRVNDRNWNSVSQKPMILDISSITY